MSIQSKDIPRLLVSMTVLLLFSWVLFNNPESELLVGALIAMATSAADYWLGSSKGSSDKTEQIKEMQNSTQDVKVVNPPDDPANVVEQPAPAEELPDYAR